MLYTENNYNKLLENVHYIQRIMLTTDKVQIIYLDPLDLKYYRLNTLQKVDPFEFDGKGIVDYVYKTKTLNVSLSTNMEKKYNGLVDIDTIFPLITHPFVNGKGQVIAIIQVEYNDIYKQNRSDDISLLDNEILEIYYGNVKTKLVQLFEELNIQRKELDRVEKPDLEFI